MDGMTIFVLVVFGIMVVGGIGAFVYMQHIKKKESGNANNVPIKTSSKSNKTTFQPIVTNGSNSADWFPIREVRDGIVQLKDYNFRMFINVSSINYGLRTEDEQDRIEAMFSRFLNSIKYPFSIYVQSRMLNLDDFLENIKKNTNAQEKTYELTEELMRYNILYYNELSHYLGSMENMNFGLEQM